MQKFVFIFSILLLASCQTTSITPDMQKELNVKESYNPLCIVKVKFAPLRFNQFFCSDKS